VQPVRWRDRSRRSLLRWDAGRLYGVYAIITGAAWVAAAENFWGTATASHHALADGGRLVDALVGVVALAIAGGLTWLGVLYLHRPLVEVDRDN
jgi:hypothetical protein